MPTLAQSKPISVATRSHCPLQYPHRGVRELGFLPDRHGVYISRWHHGSPAHRYGLYALHWVSGEAGPLQCAVVVGPMSQGGSAARFVGCLLGFASSCIASLAALPATHLTMPCTLCALQR